MKKNNNGFVGVDMTIAVFAIIIFSTLIVSLMFNTFLENLKIKKEALATIYLTETLENVGIVNYDDITQENIDSGVINLIPPDIESYNYTMKIEVLTDSLSLSDAQKQTGIVKKVKATISYIIGNKNYQYIMERAKIKE